MENDAFKATLSPSWRDFLRGLHRRVRTAVEFHRLQALLSRNRELRTFPGQRERCFIVGTGPSINEQDLTLLRGEITFVVNGFYLHPRYDDIDPTFHCGADLGLGVDTPGNVTFFRDLERVVTRATLILPTDAEPIVRKYGLFKNRRIHYLFLSEGGCDRGRVRMDLTRPISAVANVTLAMIMVASYMGFRNIYLLGCDHDFLATPTITNHFYGQDPHWPDDAGTYPYEIALENMLRLWRSYRHVGNVVSKRGGRIFNASRRSFLDVFPRVSYEGLMAPAKVVAPTGAP